MVSIITCFPSGIIIDTVASYQFATGFNTFFESALGVLVYYLSAVSLSAVYTKCLQYFVSKYFLKIPFKS